MSENDLFIVIGNAYSFLSTMPKSKKIVAKIYERLNKGSGVVYGGYLQWINNAVSKKFR